MSLPFKATCTECGTVFERPPVRCGVQCPGCGSIQQLKELNIEGVRRRDRMLHDIAKR